MKWLGFGEGDEVLKFEMERGPQRTQDDASVGYVFQRPHDPEFPTFAPKQLRWANMAGDDSIIDVSSRFINIYGSFIDSCIDYVDVVERMT